MSDMTVGRVAFEAYREKKGGTTYDGKPIPGWDDVGPDVRAAWEASGEAVLEAMEQRPISFALDFVGARIIAACTPSRERSIVLTKIEEAALWLTRCPRSSGRLGA